MKEWLSDHFIDIIILFVLPLVIGFMIRYLVGGSVFGEEWLKGIK